MTSDDYVHLGAPKVPLCHCARLYGERDESALFLLFFLIAFYAKLFSEIFPCVCFASFPVFLEILMNYVLEVSCFCSI
jgi:hypothetical protein